MSRPQLPAGRFYISASQKETWDRCKRAWAGDKMYGLRKPAGPAAELGTAIHASLEGYYQGKGIQSHNKIVASMLKCVPEVPPGAPGLVTEQQLLLPLAEGEGKILPTWLLGYIDLWYPRAEVTKVIDWKTTGDARYVKTREYLEEEDTQAGAYGLYSYRTHPGAPLEMSWVYGFTKGRTPPQRVNASPHPERCEQVGASLVEASIEMQKLKIAKVELKSVEPSYGEACNAFGGCPLKEQCAKWREEEESMDRAALLAKYRKAKDTVKSDTVDEADPINPPEKEKVVEKAEPVKEDVDTEKPEEDTTDKPKKRGRPKKSNKTEEPSPPAPENPSPPSKDSQGADAGGLHLYVGCYPQKGAQEPVMLLSDVIQGAADAVAKDAGVPHWGLAEFASGAFGLNVEFAKRMPRSGSLVVDAFSAEGKAVLPLLERVAVLVVK